MIQDPVRRSRVKRTLLIIIIATIPCYLLGGVVLLVNEGISGRSTPSAPTATIEQVNPEISATPSPTLPIPTAIFPTRTETMTPTISLTPTVTRTYVIPTSTPSDTPTSTATEPPPTDTPNPATEPPPGEN